ncbi:hypothetical protein AAFF_G00193170 [Aldrovandia affinis]|uniref:SWI/SNF-related matrix-associated actin-dependent regulator of chromatin subfamily A-like protein 1 n=1 Tax=Aldrovandia affinis TaxID=143900 RepID=A0AAD7RJ04_9TELE|nr:hypothetical protein AAFF_G00193170 [Aldrovandia affinis]
MSGSLTAEQQRRMEENRQRALARRAERLAQKGPGSGHRNPTVPQNLSSRAASHSFPTHPAVAQPPGAHPTAHPPIHSHRGPNQAAWVSPESWKTPRSTPTPSAPKQIKVIDPLPLPVAQIIASGVNRHTGNFSGFKPPEPKSNVAPVSAAPPNTATSYGHGFKSDRVPQKMPPSTAASSSTVPVKKPAVSVRGKCVCLSAERFTVEVGYNTELIAVFKNLPSRTYDPATKMWTFSLDHYHQLMEEAGGISSVSLQPLEGADVPAAPRCPQDTAALLRLCHGWQKAGAAVRGRCVLLSRSQFEVDVGYHADVIALFKQMPSKSYDMKTRKWSFLLEDYKKLMDVVIGLPLVEVEPLPRAVVQAFSPQFEKSRSRPAQVPEADLSRVDLCLTHSLMPFQRDGVSFAVSRAGRLLLADDMGLGKTIQAICIAAFYREEWPVLVVTPSSVRFTWAQAFRRWLPSLRPDDINVVVKGKDSLGSGQVNIVSYDLLSKMDKQQPTNPFNVLIMDESHFLRNMKTARCKAALSLLKAAKRVILLSGTPAMSRPAELYTQILAVRPAFFPKFHEFGTRYCDGKKLPWGWDYSGSSNLSELKLLLEESLMLRRLKTEVLSQLPAKQRKVVTVTTDGITTRAKAALTAAAKQLAQRQQSKKQEKEALLVFFNHTAEAKVRAINEYILELLECGREKFLVFAHHKLILDSVVRELGDKGISYIRIDGATPSAERQLLCDRFQFSEKSCVAVLSITAANMGLTLHSAALVVFAELFWNPGVMIQAEDRVHRIGQTSNVDIHYLVAKGTADDYLWPMIQEKMNVLEQVGLSESNLSENAECASFYCRDPQQKSIMEMFQRSFTEEGGVDEDILLQAAEAWDESDTRSTSTHPGNVTESPSKKTIMDYFCK